MENRTAVEWFMTQLPMGLKITIADKLEQAKQMEKIQIARAYENGYSDGFDDAQTINPICKIEFNTSGEQYYDDTFE